MKGKFYILSIDGGGLKGLIAIKILRVIEDIINQKATLRFNLLAGTSTGGLIAAALATGDPTGKSLYDLAHIENMYAEVGQSVFKTGGLSITGRETEKFENLLKRTFEDRRLADAVVPLFVPTFDVSSGKIIVFKTRSALQNKLKNPMLIDVCRATSAIPPVFSTYGMNYNGKKIQCLDAGLYLKNPALSALAEVLKHKKYYNVESEKDIILLSISTGSHISGNRHWSTNIRDILNNQRHDMEYIARQKLDIDFKKIGFMRVDLKLGGSAFSFMQLFEWLSKIHALSEDDEFKSAVCEILC